MGDRPLWQIQDCLDEAQEAVEEAIELISARSDRDTPMMEALASRLRGILLALGDATSAEFRRAVVAEDQGIEGEN